MRDILVTITGRRGSGKDALAKIGVEKFGCAGSVALSDWFKKILAKEFRLPLADFYSEKKDEPFKTPIRLSMGDFRRLKRNLIDLGMLLQVDRMSVVKWENREIGSIRELMLWFANEWITKEYGDEFHCKVTEAQALKQVPRKEGAYNVIFITDARQLRQVNFFKKSYEVFPIKIDRPDGPHDSNSVENAVDEFPESGYFFDTIVNDGTLEDLESKVKNILTSLKENVAQKYNTEVKQPPTKAKKETKK